MVYNYCIRIRGLLPVHGKSVLLYDYSNFYIVFMIRVFRCKYSDFFLIVLGAFQIFDSSVPSVGTRLNLV